MATKFITCRIPVPYIRLNRCVSKKEESYVTSDDFAIQIFDIQTRIAALRSSLGWTKKSNKTTPSQSKPMVVQEPQQPKDNTEDVQAAREAELNDLKAKLLGKKK